MSGINPQYLTVKSLLQARSFAIDDYQREYKWGSKNIAELVSDLQAKFLTSYHDGDAPKSSSLYAERPIPLMCLDLSLMEAHQMSDLPGRGIGPKCHMGLTRSNGPVRDDWFVITLLMAV